MPRQGKSLDGLHPTLMRPRVEAVLADREAQEMGVTVVSAFRSVAYQAVLWAGALLKYGTPARARKWVAPPGKSNHGPKVEGFGTAVDFGVRGVKAISGQWPPEIVTRFDAIARRHGLHSPMEWEDWHFEPIPNWPVGYAVSGATTFTAKYATPAPAGVSADEEALLLWVT